MNFQIHTHIQKLREQSLVQKDVHSNSPFPTYFLQVSEDVDVCEYIHHHGNHLQGQGEKGKLSARTTTICSPLSGLWTLSHSWERIPIL